MPNKVYVLERWDYNECDVLGVFGSLTAAQNRVAVLAPDAYEWKDACPNPWADWQKTEYAEYAAAHQGLVLSWKAIGDYRDYVIKLWEVDLA